MTVYGVTTATTGVPFKVVLQGCGRPRQSPFSRIRAARIVAWLRNGPAITMNTSASQVSPVFSSSPDCASTAKPTISGATSAIGVTKCSFW